MPETKLKKLYMAKCIDDLDKRFDLSDLKFKNINHLCNGATNLYKNAEIERKNGDEEKSYILYMRFINLLLKIQKHPAYQKDKKYVMGMISSDSSEKAINFATELKESLIARYQNENRIRESQSNLENLNENIDSNIKVKDSVTEVKTELSNAIGENEISINVLRLFSLLKANEKEIMVLDTRPSVDFEKSHIIFPQCINVPEECIKPGVTAHRLEVNLPSSAKNLWSQRSSMDIIVILDWSSVSVITGKTLHLMKTILMKWDRHIVYKREPIFLEGGYEEWLSTYPTYTTNPHYRKPENFDLDDLLDDIEYPMLNETHTQIDNKSIFERNYFKEKNENVNSITKILNPGVDRSSKAAAVQTYNERANEMKRILEEQEKLATFSLDLEKKRVIAEENWGKLQVNPEKESEEEANQLRQQELLSEIMKLENDQRDMILENQQLKEQLEEYKRKEMEDSNKTAQLSPNSEISSSASSSISNGSPNSYHAVSINDESADLKEEALAKEEKIRIIEEERAAVEKQREPMQADREKILADARAKKRLLHEKQIQEENKSPSDSDDISSGINTSQSPQYIKKIPDDKSNAKTPQFDRTTKPYQTAISDQYNRQRDFQGISGSSGRGLTGLKNLGNTCYMNSIMQCLNNTPYLDKYFREGIYKKHVHDNSHGKEGRTQGAVAIEVAAVVQALWSDQYRFISIKDLRNVLGKYQSMFRGVEQQDSHEFLTILMDWLHDDLQISIAQQNHMDRLPPAEKAWLEYTNSKDSLILKLFYGQIKSTVRCSMCGKESITYDSFSNLSLELPANANKCSLSDCLELYLRDEKIMGWNCPSCNDKRDAVKKLDISKLPPVLVIHFKRFYVDHKDYISNTFRKKQTYINFPLEKLDMGNFSLQSSENTKYNLYGVSNHYGSMESGHYTAYCKSSHYSKWYKFDDHLVAEISPSDVVSSAAYILFYTSYSDSAFQQ